MIQALGITFSGVILMWFGYSLFFGPASPLYNRGRRSSRTGYCPVCSVEMFEGEKLKSMVFPAFTGNGDRLVYIKGCTTCLTNHSPRKCPFCGSRLNLRDFLVSKMSFHSNHSHTEIVGCNHCKPSLSKRAV
jgi:RNA polymerase subunit RPABC4/transcription elongation factor Spt4